MTDRRNFIAALACGGAAGCVSTGALPEVGEAPFFSRRGKRERLSLSFIQVKAGATRPFSMLHLSDTHLTAADPDEGPLKQKLRDERTRTFGGHQEEALVDALAWAKAHADYVLHTGDLVDWQSEANFARVKKHLGADVMGALGNHDYSPDLGRGAVPDAPTEEHRARTRAKLAATYPYDPTFTAQVVNGVNVITLDDVYATVTAEQVRRFKAEAAKGLPIMLAMHVPFYTDFIWHADQTFWGGWTDRAAPPPVAGEYLCQREDPVTRDFISYLKEEKLLKAILAGHLHVAVRDSFSPTATEYVVGGNYLFNAAHVMVS